MICPNCGKTINDGDIFCAYCRQRVDGQQAQQPVQPAYRQNAPIKRQNPAAVFFATLLVGGALIAAFVLFIKPGYMLKKDDGDSSSKEKKTASSVSAVENEVDEDSSETVTTAAPEAAEPVNETSPAETETTAAATTTTAPETTTTETTTTAAATQSAEDIAKEEAAAYSTNEKPSFGEFEWCYGQFGLVQDPPGNVEYLMEPGSWTGGWKCMIVYSTSENAEQYIREINNVCIGIEGTSIDMTVRHHIYEIDGVSYDDSITADRKLTGQVVNGPFEVVGGERVTMRSFWRENGHEYAVGDMMMQDGTDAYIAFYR